MPGNERLLFTSHTQSLNRMPPKNHHTTIYQVATEAGVAISTVSKVLSNKPGVSVETRAKVQETIQRLGYFPSLAARSLPRGRTGIVAVVFAFPPKLLFTDPYLLQNMLGIKEALDAAECNMLLSTGREADPTSSFDRLLRSRYFDGAILLETTDIHKLDLHLKIVKHHNLPWVMMGFPGGLESSNAVYADDYSGGRAIAQHLTGLGHRSFAIVSTITRPSGVDERVRGFQEHLQSKGITVDPDLCFYGDFSEESGYKFARSLLYRPNRPSAIFAVNDRIALGIIKWAQEQGLRVPDDFSIVGFDDIESASQAHPALTTVRQPGIKIGQAAANMVLRLIDGQSGPQQEIYSTELIIRGTTRPPLLIQPQTI
jgi:DNA-binding LacI/PurR family transcriptional regulator